MKGMVKKKREFSSFQIMALGFAGVIVIGAIILMLPISSASGVRTPFINALFTSTTSVCVTGLIVYDTGTYWSEFGQAVILALIQIGGLGIITVAASFALIAGRRIGLFQRSTMQEAVAAPKISGIVRLTKFILRMTFGLEFMGAVIMAPKFISRFGIAKGLWFSVFHSISAFCNAGLDLMGENKAFSSLTSYVDDPVINLVIMGLIIFGGLGFLTWDDIHTHGIHLRKYRMQSKVILTTTGILILLPAILFFVLEFDDMPLKRRILASLFQAITPRTAGFNTVDLTLMSEPAKLIIIILMLIGGSPGSTAGGMKTTTFAVLIACSISVFKRQDSAKFYGRRIAHDAILTAATLAFMYIGLCITGGIIICFIEELPLLSCIFETASAIGTVGLTLGITTKLNIISKCILIIFMYIGRVGGLTLIYATLSEKKMYMGRFPLEKITIG